MFILLIIFGFVFANNCIVCPEDTVMNYGGSVVRTDIRTPNCSDVSDIATVWYPSQASLNCGNSYGKIHSETVWFGVIFGECTPNYWCGYSNCTGVNECGRQGYTIKEYNDCYNARYGCNGKFNSTFTVEPINSTSIYLKVYSNLDCSGPPDSEYVTYVDWCQFFGVGCGSESWSSRNWVYLENCSNDPDTNSTSGSPNPEPSSASTLYSLWSCFPLVLSLNRRGIFGSRFVGQGSSAVIAWWSDLIPPLLRVVPHLLNAMMTSSYSTPVFR